MGPGVGHDVHEDRIARAALKAILEPVGDRLPAGHLRVPAQQSGSGRDRGDRLSPPPGSHVVLETGIEACFDNSDHAALTDRLAARISDELILALVKAFVKTGGMKHRRHGVNVQAVTVPGRQLRWLSPTLPGRVHDPTAARTPPDHPHSRAPGRPRPGRSRRPGRRLLTDRPTA